MREILIKNYHSEQSKRLQYENPLPSLVEKLDNEYIDSILSLLSQRIKANALTDEQIKSIKKQAFEEWSESPEYSQAWSGGEFSFRQLRDQIYDRAVAASQLQAVLGELE